MNLKKILNNLYFIPKIVRKQNRERLVNDNFTILASNCIGGIIYHCLGKQFLSPTINLRISSNEFIKFLHNFDHYINSEIVFDDTVNLPYPCGRIDDVHIHFNHSKTKTDALEKWETRKKRINKDNIYVLLNDLDGVTESDIRSLKSLPVKNILVFTHKKYDDIPYTYYVGDEKKLKSILGKSKLTGLYNFEYWFDYVSWLNDSLN